MPLVTLDTENPTKNGDGARALREWVHSVVTPICGQGFNGQHTTTSLEAAEQAKEQFAREFLSKKITGYFSGDGKLTLNIKSLNKAGEAEPFRLEPTVEGGQLAIDTDRVYRALEREQVEQQAGRHQGRGFGL